MIFKTLIISNKMENAKQKAIEKSYEEEINFGDYVLIEHKRYGCENENYSHKVINSFESNTWVDVPVQYPAKEVSHSKIEKVVSCIVCGVEEKEVLRYRLSDVKKITKKIY